jgi:restriction system protein
MARRRRSQKQSLFEDLFEITAKSPWWVGVVLAAVFYLWLHHYAAAEVVKTTTPGAIGGAVVSQVFRSLALVGQYLLPAVFLLGALASAISRAKNKPVSISEPLMDPAEPRVEPTQKGIAPGADLYELWKAPALGAGAAVAPRPDRWSLDLLRAIDWKRFEEVCAEYFRLCGFHATTQSSGTDGGIDVKLYAPNDQSKIVNIVQCKQWSKPVGPKALREFLGVLTAGKLPRGVFVTSSTFNDEATRFAAENQIHLLDGRRFLNKIMERPPADQTRLLTVATEGDYLTPSCPSCGIKLIKRESRKDKSTFWGCSNFPRCKYILHA